MADEKKDTRPDARDGDKAKKQPREQTLRPLGRKVPEPEGNLEHRSEWFEKRHSD
jgi:hypothetical protein